MRDGIRFETRVRVDAYDRHGRHMMRALDDQANFIVDAGKTSAIMILSGLVDAWPQSRRIARLAIGDAGAVPGFPFTPKTPDGTWPGITSLFHEIGRQDISTITSSAPQQATFLTSVLSSNYTAGNFSSAPFVINEAGLIVSRGVAMAGVTQPPAAIPSDESLFSIRTFPSVPFAPADGVTVVLLWSVFVA
jgi:hypothetical protein